MRLVSIFLVLLFLPISVMAKVAPGQFYFEFANEDKGSFHNVSEELYGEDDSDGGMTSSIFMSYMFPLSPREIVTVYMDQAAFTPKGANKRELTVQEGDRPFASYMSVGANYKFMYGPNFNSVGLRLLGTGKYGMGETILNSLHEFAGKDTYDGWQDEIDDKVGFVAEYRGVARQFGVCLMVCAEFNPHIAVDAGNIVNKAATGATVRIGNRLPEDFGPSDFSLFSKGTQYVASTGFAWEVFMGTEARYVFSNYLLEGDTKITGASVVDMNHWQADFQTGLNLSYIGRGMNGTFGVTLIRRSREFEGQNIQQFLRFGLGLQF